MSCIRNVGGVRLLPFFICTIQSSVYGSESKPILYWDTVYGKFLRYVSVEIDSFSFEQTSAI